MRWLGQARVVARAIPVVRRRLGTARAVRLGFYEVVFDLRRGTETSLELPPVEHPPDERTERHEAANPLLFADLLRRVPASCRTGTFLDLGAGKGRALLLAADAGFTRSIGVELSARFCAIARRNVASYRRRRRRGVQIDVLRADAATFAVPVDVGVLFLFNPFGRDIIAAVLDRVEESLALRPRAFYVIYLCPRHETLLRAAGFSPVYRQGDDGVVLRRRPPRRERAELLLSRDS